MNLYRRSIWVLLELVRKWTQAILHKNRLGETYNWKKLHLEAHDYRIYYVNIDLRRQYGISVAESQTFLLGYTIVEPPIWLPDWFVKKEKKKKNKKISKGGFLSISVAALIAGSTSLICRKSCVTLFNERSFFLFNATWILITFFSLQVQKHSRILPKDAAASANSYTSLAFILKKK